MPNPPRKPTPVAVPIVPSTPTRNVPFMKEDPTPVDMPLPAVLDRRSKQTKETVDETQRAVALLRDDLRIYVDNDNKEHADLRKELSAIGDRYETLDKKVDELAMASANANGKLDILVDSVKAQHAVMIHREKVTVEREATQERLDLEDKVDEKKFKRQKWLKFFGIVAAIVGAGAAAAKGLF